MTEPLKDKRLDLKGSLFFSLIRNQPNSKGSKTERYICNTVETVSRSRNGLFWRLIRDYFLIHRLNFSESTNISQGTL